MKKCVVRALLSLVACLALVDTAAGVEEGSLLFQNSFGLYYLEDPFDLTLNPAFISEIDRWRLFTNLSNYEDANSYLIGTSGRLGPGSLGLFYERDERDIVEESSHSSYLTTDFLAAASGSPRSLSRSNLVTAESEMERFEEESTRDAFIATYGMDFGSFSLGASYRPSSSSGSFTLEGSIDEDPDYETDPQWWGRPSFTGDLKAGENFSRARRETVTEEAIFFHDRAESEAFDGKAEVDEDRHGVAVGSQLRFWKRLPVWVRLGAQSVDRTVSGAGRYSYSTSETYGMDGAETESESRTSSWGGDPVGGSDDHSFDGTEWSLEVVPRYTVSEFVTIELQLGFRTMEGDVTGGWTQDIAIDRAVKRSDSGRTERWKGSQSVENSFSGDSDADGYSVAPRVYLTYGGVEFALGFDYAHLRDEVTGSQRGEGRMSWSYDDGNGARDAGDWTYAGSFTSHGERSFEFTTTVVSLPVATRFRVTDKLELRAGAAYVRTDTETKRSGSTREDELYTITDGTGSIIGQGPGTQGGDERESEESTEGTTYYRLGAGYRATENLQFDLLFSQSTGGGVDTSVVYASAVFAF